MSASDSEQDWRLRVALHGGAGAEAARGIIARFRGPHVVRDAEAAVGADVVLTHDGDTLFVYAADRDAIRAAQTALEGALERDGAAATFTVGHWEDDLGEWVQVEPPPDAAAQAAHDRAVRDAHAPAVETFVVRVGKEIRSEFEQSMLAWARERGLRCEVVEHPHLLETQVAFTVSGASHDVDEFRAGLEAEERATVRTEYAVMTSPL